MPYETELRKRIIRHEGKREKPYTDSVGKLSIGVGRNLTENGLRDDEIMLMLDNDIDESFLNLSQFPWFHCMNYVRKGALVELCFNIGLPSFLTFKKMIAALEKQDFEKAACEMLDSLWSRQVGAKRANDIANRLLKGAYA